MTARYSSPEQYQAHSFETSKRITKQSDVYSLGVVILELTGVNVKEKWVLKQKLRYKPFDKYLNEEFDQLNERVIKPMMRYSPSTRISLEEVQLNLSEIIMKENHSQLSQQQQQQQQQNSQSKIKINKDSLKYLLVEQPNKNVTRAVSLENAISPSHYNNQQAYMQQSQLQGSQIPPPQQVQSAQAQSGQERIKAYLMKRMSSLNLLPNQSNIINQNVNNNIININNNMNNNQSTNGNTNNNNNNNNSNNNSNFNNNNNNNLTSNNINGHSLNGKVANLQLSNYNSPNNSRGNINLFSNNNKNNNNNYYQNNNITPVTHQNNLSTNYLSCVSPTNNNMISSNNTLFSNNKGEYGQQQNQQSQNTRTSSKKRNGEEQLGSARARVSSLLALSPRMSNLSSLVSPSSKDISPLKKRVQTFQNTTNNNSFFQNHNMMSNSKIIEQNQQKSSNNANIPQSNNKNIKISNILNGVQNNCSPSNIFQGNQDIQLISTPLKSPQNQSEVELFHRVPNNIGKFYNCFNQKQVGQSQQTPQSAALVTGNSSSVNNNMGIEKPRTKKNSLNIETKIVFAIENKQLAQTSDRNEIDTPSDQISQQPSQKQQKQQVQQIQVMPQEQNISFLKQQHPNITNSDMNNVGRSPSAQGSMRWKISPELNNQSPKRARGYQPLKSQQPQGGAMNGKIQVRSISQQMLFKRACPPQVQVGTESPSVSLSPLPS